MNTTAEKRTQLRLLANQARTQLFDMLKLTHEILSDPEYLEEHGGEAALMSHLEATEFAHFGGKPTLANMLAAYRKNPEKSVWDEYRHNIVAMIDLAQPPKVTESVERVNWKAKAQELEVKVEMLEAELNDLRQKHEKALIEVGRSMAGAR